MLRLHVLKQVVALAFLSFFPGAQSLSPVGPSGIDAVLDCGVRDLAYGFATRLQPWRPAASLAAVHDALRLAVECNKSLVLPAPAHRATPAVDTATELRAPAATYYADAVLGDDANSGSQAAPFATVARGVAAARGGPTPATLLLRDTGPFWLPEPLALGPADSGLTVAAYSGEAPVLSGGKPLTALQWVKTGMGSNMSAPVANSSVVSNIPGLLPGGSVPGVVQFAGSFTSWPPCAAACSAAPVCNAVTWHDASCGRFALNCFLRIDGAYPLEGGLSGHLSARKTLPGASVWKAALPSLPLPLLNLYSGASGRRLTRAKAPDGNPETTLDGFFSSSSAVAWLPPLAYPLPTDVKVAEPTRADDPHFPSYQLGLGGSCAQFDPPEGFWCSTDPPGGATYSVPSGVVLPAGLLPPAAEAGPPTAILHAFQGDYWGDWKFQVAAASDDRTSLNWTWGGFQEARGCRAGGNFMVENALELLDAPDEWYFDASSSVLYVAFNDTAPPTAATVLVAAQLDALVRVVASADAPVVNLTLAGLTFLHTAPTFMKPYTMPPGGDWSVRQDAAVVLEGTEGAAVDGCVFSGIGGNALLLHRYNRRASITACEFAYVGDSAIVSLGEVQGIDGTARNVPVGTRVADNLGREIGLYTKQSGFYYHALSANATVTGNIAFNMPRAGISINDGYAGGHNISHNLIFNAVRETSDHGCLNTWDREPLMWDGARPDLLYPLTSTVERNFFVSNYRSTWPIDHDDGSNSYLDRHNFLAWGGAKNYGGFNRTYKGNFYLYPDAAAPADRAEPHGAVAALLAAGVRARVADGAVVFASPADAAAGAAVPLKAGTGFAPYCYWSEGQAKLPPAQRDSWAEGEVCVALSSGGLYSFASCDPSNPIDGQLPLMSNNTLYFDKGVYSFQCGTATWSLADAQNNGVDLGTSQGPSPDTTELLAMAATFVQAL
jgi:hypothetical protein